MEEVWGTDIPRTAATTLQTYIMQIRRKLEVALHRDSRRSAKDVLVTCPGVGYMLNPVTCDSDAVEFARQAKEGARLLDEGDAVGASTMLSKALGQWRGPVFVDVPTGQILGLAAVGIEEQRMRVLEQRVEADLQLGYHSALLADLAVLVVAHPIHENFCAQFMLALYRAGHASRALCAYQNLRRTLADELGVDPSPRLQALYQAVLNTDPALDAPGFGVLTGPQAPVARPAEQMVETRYL